MSDPEKNHLVDSAKGLSKWFRIEIKISVLGTVIFHKIFPPES